MKKLVFNFFGLILMGASSIFCMSPKELLKQAEALIRNNALASSPKLIDKLDRIIKELQGHPDEFGWLGFALAVNPNLPKRPDLISMLKYIVNHLKDNPGDLSFIGCTLLDQDLHFSPELISILKDIINKLHDDSIWLNVLEDSFFEEVSKIESSSFRRCLERMLQYLAIKINKNKADCLQNKRVSRARENLNQLISYSLIYRELDHKNNFYELMEKIAEKYVILAIFFAKQDMADELLVISVELYDLYDAAEEAEENACHKAKLAMKKDGFGKQVSELLLKLPIIKLFSAYHLERALEISK